MHRIKAKPGPLCILEKIGLWEKKQKKHCIAYRLLRFNDHPVTPQRITASNWLLKLEIANCIHYLTSACVILVINKAWHLPFASSKVCRKIYQGLEKAIYGASGVWAIIWGVIHSTKDAQHREKESPSSNQTSARTPDKTGSVQERVRL